MISKRIQPNRNGKISYTSKQSTSNLVKYIAKKAIENMTNYATSKTYKTWYINLPDEKDLAIAQMQSTQAKNNTNSSKIYHYIVSFDNGEQPKDEIMLDIENSISHALGYKEYQRVIAIHDDTAHYHMHVVINTIHPTKHINRNSPSNDFYIRNDMMRKLEKKHNLNIDNGIEVRNTQVLKNYKSIDFEKHTRLESFTTYLQKEIKEPALEVKNWQELHKAAKQIGVVVKLQGNGLVFKSINSKETVKASTVDRKLSKSQLEQKLGIFEEQQTIKHSKNAVNAPQRAEDTQNIQIYIQEQNNSIQATIEPQKTYVPKPLHKNSDNLWQKYLDYKKSNSIVNQEKKLALKKVFDLQTQTVKQIWQNKTLAFNEKKHLQHQVNIMTIKNKYAIYAQDLDDKTKLIYGKYQDKFIQLESLKYTNLQNINNRFLSNQDKLKLVHQADKIYTNALSGLKNEIKKEFMQNKHNSLSWIDFLRDEVKTNPQAISILQSVEAKAKLDKPYIAGVKIQNIILENAKISKNGTIFYKTADGGIFTDEETKITVIKNSKQAQEQSYNLAKQQFKHTMAIKGNLEYWQQQKGLEL